MGHTLHKSSDIMKKFQILLIVAYLTIDLKVDASKEVVKTMSLNYGKGLEECKKEMNLPDAIDDDFKNFWKEGFQIANRETGCAVMCLSKKLDLLSSDGSLHHGNAQDFVMKHGGDENMAKQMVGMFHECEKAVTPNSDPCVMVVEIMHCFKAEIHKLDWAPDMDLVMSEVLAEV